MSKAQKHLFEAHKLDACVNERVADRVNRTIAQIRTKPTNDSLKSNQNKSPIGQPNTNIVSFDLIKDRETYNTKATPSSTRSKTKNGGKTKRTTRVEGESRHQGERKHRQGTLNIGDIVGGHLESVRELVLALGSPVCDDDNGKVARFQNEAQILMERVRKAERKVERERARLNMVDKEKNTKREAARNMKRG